MKFKLDENLGTSCAKLLQEVGYDVTTVQEEGLCSIDDQRLILICKSEKRVFVTLDLDFGNPLLFKPSQYEGIVVIRLPPRPSLLDLIRGIKTLIGGLGKEKIQGKLWIVHDGRIRIFEEE